MNKIKVLIIEDSLVVRELLTHIISSDPRFDIVGAATSAEEGLVLLHQTQPDVISLDIRLPGMNGLDATLKIMAERPTPIVVVAANVDDDELNIAMNALRAGALAVVEKPVGVASQGFEAVARRLCTQLAIMSQVKVVRQGPCRKLDFGTAAAPHPVGTGDGEYQILGIVASTGGPQALTDVLGTLPPTFALPVLVVQHITPGFTDAFVSWLGSVIALPVHLAQDGQSPQPGHVYVAPSDCHLEMGVEGLLLKEGQPVGGQRPSGTLMLKSLARRFGRRAVGLVMTGMGADGAEGLAAIKQAGGYTLAEDESTCVVFGMPAEARKIGAVREMLPRSQIGPRIVVLVEGVTA